MKGMNVQGGKWNKDIDHETDRRHDVEDDVSELKKTIGQLETRHNKLEHVGTQILGALFNEADRGDSQHILVIKRKNAEWEHLMAIYPAPQDSLLPEVAAKDIANAGPLVVVRTKTVNATARVLELVTTLLLVNPNGAVGIDKASDTSML